MSELLRLLTDVGQRGDRAAGVMAAQGEGALFLAVGIDLDEDGFAFSPS